MPEVFIKRERKAKPGFNMAVVMNNKATKGELGIEVEVEGNQFPKPPGAAGTHTPTRMPGMTYWSYVHDGSLRGTDNAEYILTKPIAFKDTQAAVTELFAGLTQFGSVIDDSHRTSVHVHLNCQEFHLNRLCSFMGLWYALEEVLTEWCGEHRVGNLFCLRAMDAPAIIAQLRMFFRKDGAVQLSEHLHYAGLNAHALSKYGSIEVRTLRGCTDPQTILDWCSILQRLYELSAEFPDPRDICSLFSAEGPLAFFEYILRDRAPIVRSAISYNDDQIRDAMYNGVRLAQDLCFCRDWAEYNPVKLRPDPFSRNLKTVAKKLQAAPASTGVSLGSAGSSPYNLNVLDEYEPDYDDSHDELAALSAYGSQAGQMQQASPIPPIPSWATLNPFSSGGSNG
jgi:hypothetical protein